MIALLIVIGVLLVLLLLVFLHIFDMKNDMLDMREQEHSDCVETMMDAVSNAHAIAVLNSAAMAWDSAEEQQRLLRLTHQQYVPGGPSMPQIWLKDRANRLAEMMRESAREKIS